MQINEVKIGGDHGYNELTMKTPMSVMKSSYSRKSIYWNDENSNDKRKLVMRNDSNELDTNDWNTNPEVEGAAS